MGKKKELKPHRLQKASVPVATDGHALVHSVRGARDDVVKFVGHAPRARHVGHTAWPVQLGRQDVVQHATRVADLEAARFDAAHLQRSRTSLGGHSLQQDFGHSSQCGGRTVAGPMMVTPFSSAVLMSFRV